MVLRCCRKLQRADLVKGNEYDTEKAAKLMLDDFRNGRLGRITLEFPDEMDA